MSAILVLTTTSSIKEAESLADQIVAEKLAACVQILPPMSSVYFWEGEMRKESEHMLVMKTLPEKYNALENFILANHSYDVPEIVAIRAAKISAGYLKWMTDYLS